MRLEQNADPLKKKVLYNLRCYDMKWTGPRRREEIIIEGSMICFYVLYRRVSRFRDYENRMEPPECTVGTTLGNPEQIA